MTTFDIPAIVADEFRRQRIAQTAPTVTLSAAAIAMLTSPEQAAYRAALVAAAPAGTRLIDDVPSTVMEAYHSFIETAVASGKSRTDAIVNVMRNHRGISEGVTLADRVAVAQFEALIRTFAALPRWTRERAEAQALKNRPDLAKAARGVLAWRKG